MATEFTPLASLAGGALIGASAVLLMGLLGRVAGISGLLRSALFPSSASSGAISAAFIAGLVLAPMAWSAAGGAPIVQDASSSVSLNILAGLLVGFGSVAGSGCTSGHGVCGLSRLSLRSLAATATFMAAGALVVFLIRHVLGGWTWA